jgi:hypothetical protein
LKELVRHFPNAMHAIKIYAWFVPIGKIRANLLAQRNPVGKSDFKIFARYFPIVERSF